MNHIKRVNEMRNYNFLGSYAAAALAMAANVIDLSIPVIRSAPVSDFSAPKRRLTGKTYPHSSKRQNDRIARQLAAGQISFIQHGPRA